MATGLSGMKIGEDAGVASQISSKYNVSDLGMRREQLQRMKEKFDEAGESAPSGLVKLLNDYDKYDKSYDDNLQIEEMKEFAEDNKLSVEDGPIALLYGDEGMSLGQLDVMLQLAKEEHGDTETLERLTKNFETYDRDGDATIDKKEFEKFMDKAAPKVEEEAGDSGLVTYLKKQAVAAYEGKELATSSLLGLY